MTKSNARPTPPTLIEFLDELRPDHFLPLESENIFRGMIAVMVDGRLLPELLSETLNEGIPIQEVLLRGCPEQSLEKMSAYPNYTPVGAIKIKVDAKSLTVAPSDWDYLTVGPIPMRRYRSYSYILRLLKYVAGEILIRTEQFLAEERFVAGVSTMSLPLGYVN